MNFIPYPQQQPAALPPIPDPGGDIPHNPHMFIQFNPYNNDVLDEPIRYCAWWNIKQRDDYNTLNNDVIGDCDGGEDYRLSPPFNAYKVCGKHCDMTIYFDSNQQNPPNIDECGIHRGNQRYITVDNNNNIDYDSDKTGHNAYGGVNCDQLLQPPLQVQQPVGMAINGANAGGGKKIKKSKSKAKKSNNKKSKSNNKKSKSKNQKSKSGRIKKSKSNNQKSKSRRIKKSKSKRTKSKKSKSKKT